MIVEWIKAQQIGWAASGVATFAADEEIQWLHDRASDALPRLLDEWKWRDETAMTALPLNVLRLLTRLSDDDLVEPFDEGRLKLEAQRAIDLLAPGKESPLAKAEILAHHIMNGTGGAARLTRLGLSLFPGPTWRQVERPSILDRLHDVLLQLRAPRSASWERLSALDGLMDIIGSTPGSSQVGNILMHHLFSWPLLVFPSVNTEVGISLPVAVDVELSPKPFDRPRDSVFVRSARHVHLRAPDSRQYTWLTHFQEAREAAVLLWQKTHGNHGQFRQNVWDHQTIIDFEYASQVAKGAFGLSGGESISLLGGSAAAYFSRVILARLLGKRWYLSSAVTGLIGERVVVPRDEGESGIDRDFYFVPPRVAKEGSRLHSIAQKVRHVFQTGCFERLVLPESDAVEEEVNNIRAAITTADPTTDAMPSDAVEVLYAGKLSNVADIVQIDGWRKTQFVRCPEVAWAVSGEGRPGLLAVEHPDVIRVLRHLDSSSKTVLSLEDTRPTAVASALVHIGQQVHDETQPLSPPGLSWCFIRAVKEEQGAAFWRTLWRLIGAPLRELDLLRDSPTPEIAAGRLTKALNVDTPEQDAPSHRAPDIIVIMGLEKFVASVDSNATPSAQPLTVEPLIRQLEAPGVLQVSWYRRKWDVLKKYVGLARFILLPDRGADSVTQESLKQLEPESDHALEWRALEALATFRFGFTQHMAALLLSEVGIKGVGVRHLLKTLKHAHALREAGGQYHMSHSLRDYLVQRGAGDIKTVASRHEAAGIAMAPYVIVAPVPALAYDTAFLPEHVTEAGEHLRLANDLYGKVNEVESQQRLKAGFRRLYRFAAYPHWGTVSRLSRAKNCGRDAYFMAMELMDGWRHHPDNLRHLPPHPSHVVETIEALDDWSDGPLGYIDDLFQQGLDACEHYPAQEAEFCRLQLLCVYSMHLFRHRRDELELMRETDSRIWDMRPAWRHIPGEWFEKNGDCTWDDGKAAWHYGLGVQYAEPYCQNWIKELGATALAGRDRTRLQARLSSLPDTKATMTMCRWATSAYRRHWRQRPKGNHMPRSRRDPAMDRWERVLDRWKWAFNILLELWAQIPECDQMLRHAMIDGDPNRRR